MSYKPVGQADDDGNIPLQSYTQQNNASHLEERHNGHRFFKTANSMHIAISVAAGTVMCLFGYEQGVFGGISKALAVFPRVTR